MTRSMAPLLALAMLAGCNQYELFRKAGYAQASFSNKADVLFVIDNSSSMQDEAEGMALNFQEFITKLTDPTQGAATTDGLGDAVDNYITYEKNRESIVNYQLAITTTDCQNTDPTLGYGALRGDPPILDRTTDDIATAFNRNLLCHATDFQSASSVPQDPSYQCTDPITPPGDQISAQYLNCLCGSQDVWAGHSGAGTEEPLEAIFMAMCRASDDPPEECFGNEDQFTEDDVGSNAGLMRENSTLIPIIVSDEGDTSRRMTQGDGDPSDDYAPLYDLFDTRMAFAVIGPQTEECNSGGATTWGVSRFQYFVDETGGRYFDIEGKDGNGDCQPADFASAMGELGQLLNSLQSEFPLQSIPDVDTIRVFDNGAFVPQAPVTTDDTTGKQTYGDGWSYNAADNAIQFHGSAIPPYDADLQIYYRPLSGMPRTLPF